jgi:transposase
MSDFGRTFFPPCLRYKFDLINITLKINNGNIKKTARDLCIDKNTVKRAIRYLDDPKSFPSHLGRPPKLATPQKLYVVASTRANPEATGAEIAQELNERFNIDVSPRTVNRYRDSFGFWYGPKINSFSLTDENRINRKEFAMYHLEANTDWSKIIFSDESWFELGRNRAYCWREPGVITSRHCNERKAHPLKIMIWGAIGWNFKSRLVFIEGRVDSKIYCNSIIIASYIKYEADIAFGKGNWILQQDNAPCHVSKQTREILEGYGVPILPNWPAHSPDINVIEIVWAIMKRRIEKHNPKTRPELQFIIQETWDALSFETINKLIDSVRPRLEKLVQTDGGQIQYTVANVDRRVSNEE